MTADNFILMYKTDVGQQKVHGTRDKIEGQPILRTTRFCLKIVKTIFILGQF